MKGILIDENGDIMVRNGAVVIGDCAADVAERVLCAYPGEFKEVPMIGLYATKQVNGTPDPFWRGEAKKQLKSQLVDADIDFTENENRIGIEIRINN